MAVFSVFDTLSEMSMQMALIRLPEMDRAHMDTAWTLGILRAVIIGAALALTAGLAADWMHDSRVTPIMLVMAAIAVVQGFENIGTTYFRRDLEFGKVFQYRLAGRLIAFVVTVGGAAWFHSYWALVAGIAASRLFLVAYSYVIHPYRPRISFAAVHELLHFSKVVHCHEYTRGNRGLHRDAVVQPHWWTDAQSVCTRSPGRSAACQSARSQHRSASRSIPATRSCLAAWRRSVRTFVEGLALVLMVVAPMSVGLGLTADLVWPVVLGAKWAAASDLIRLCAFYALFDSIGHFTHGIYIVLNRQRRLVLTYAPIIVVRFGSAIVIGLHWGVVPAVWSLTVTAFLSMVIWVGCALPVLELDLSELIAPIWRTIASCGMMASIMVVWLPLTSNGAPLRVVAMRLLVAVGVGAVSQISAQMALWRLCGMPAGPEQRGLRLVAHAWRRAVASSSLKRKWLQL